jgi:cytidine deaminase
LKHYEEMFRAALRARPHAYVPYSHYPVSACIRGESGRLFVGVNVDNASFPESACAEANAIGAMVTAGDRRIAAMVLVAGELNDGVLCAPCGGCRQRLAEFSTAHTPLYICGPEGLRKTLEFAQLLPHAFGRANLAGHSSPSEPSGNVRGERDEPLR